MCRFPHRTWFFTSLSVWVGFPLLSKKQYKMSRVRHVCYKAAGTVEIQWQNGLTQHLLKALSVMQKNDASDTRPLCLHDCKVPPKPCGGCCWDYNNRLVAETPEETVNHTTRLCCGANQGLSSQEVLACPWHRLTRLLPLKNLQTLFTVLFLTFH